MAHCVQKQAESGYLVMSMLQIAEAMKPNLAYFTDPSQNFISDFFGALTQEGTSLGSVSGVQPRPLARLLPWSASQ
jgi:hypothetical protein